MAGIYIHIPFCRQACHYCDFHFSTSPRHHSEMVNAIMQETESRKTYFGSMASPVSSVYFGGGTPSLLAAADLNALFEKIASIHPVDPAAEVTLEANPEDLTKDYLEALKGTPVNRLSIGIQSFHDADLQYMNRCHNAATALTSIHNAREAGYANLSIDLIYGTPTLTGEQWEKNLQTAFSLKVNHLSCYALTVEPRTALEVMIRKKKRPMVDEAKAASQFDMLMTLAGRAGMDHYEISNLCLPGYEARHNSSYWKGEPYLGLGPSAHSFNGAVRRWNISHNTKYIKSATAGMPAFEHETLSVVDRYNEYILTSLRTRWGVSASVARLRSGDALAAHLEKRAARWTAPGYLREESNIFYLTRKGMMIADRISSDLFAPA